MPSLSFDVKGKCVQLLDELSWTSVDEDLSMNGSSIVYQDRTSESVYHTEKSQDYHLVQSFWTVQIS